MRQNSLATKDFNLRHVKEFGRKIKFIFPQFTFVITRPKRCRKPLQTLIDGNLGNVSAGISISIIAHPMQTVVRPNLVSRAISPFKMAGGGDGPVDEVVVRPSFFSVYHRSITANFRVKIKRSTTQRLYIYEVS